MPTEYEEHSKSLSPVVPYKMDKAKGHRVEDTTEVDSAAPSARAQPPLPPSTPSRVNSPTAPAGSLLTILTSQMVSKGHRIEDTTEVDCAQPPLPPSTPSRVNSPTAPEADDVNIEESTSPPPPRNPRPACAWRWRCGNKVCARWQRHPGSSS